MHAMEVTQSPHGWRISLRQASDTQSSDQVSLADAARLGRTALLAWRERLLVSGADAGLVAEFPKAGIGEGELALGYAECIAGLASRSAASPIRVVTPRPWLSRRSMVLALRHHGLRVAGKRASALLDRLSFVLAGVLAWLSLLVSALVYVRRTPRLPSGDWWLAVHGEWSNRTRHVLATIDGENPPAAILVLGRPHGALDRLRTTWTGKLGAHLPPTIRPWSLQWVLATLPAAVQSTTEAIAVAAAAPYLPPFRERMAMLWRTYLGHASARWWRAQGEASGQVVYGHTGTADTILLELAQQRAGQRTVHIVHGLSAGLNFTGVSSEAWFRCAHDAEWHQRLGGYGRCGHHPLHQPELRAHSEGLLLLTNYAHPMNIACRLNGIQSEVAVLERVAAATAQVPSIGPMHWKPHPALSTLSATQQEALRRIARKLGFIELAPGTDWRALAGTARWVLTTPSTALVELLVEGVAPVLLRPGWLDPDCALAKYPIAVCDDECLVDALAAAGGMDGRGSELAQGWHAIGPARCVVATDWKE